MRLVACLELAGAGINGNGNQEEGRINVANYESINTTQGAMQFLQEFGKEPDPVRRLHLTDPSIHIRAYITIETPSMPNSRLLSRRNQANFSLVPEKDKAQHWLLLSLHDLLLVLAFLPHIPFVGQ